MSDTPIETRYPWLKVGDIRPDLPENPTVSDFAKAYATIAMVYQAQRNGIEKILDRHALERSETLIALRAIEKHQGPVPMPWWVKANSFALIVEAATIAWLIFCMNSQQHLVERLAAVGVRPAVGAQGSR